MIEIFPDFCDNGLMEYNRRIIELLLFSAIVLSIFIFWEDFASFFNPCKNPIEYSIGNIDSSFGMSDDYLLSAAEEAEGLWESASNRNLFEYSSSGGMAINLIYDYRQDSTVQLSSLDSAIETDNTYYLNLRREYEGYVGEYNSGITALNALVSDYEQRSSAYKREVNLWNKKGGLQEKYDQLNLEKASLEAMLAEIKAKEGELNALTGEINNLVRELNALAAKLNLNAESFNEISESFEGEFEQGNYTLDSGVKAITVYQFENREKLVAVLVHEMGHALGLNHSGNPKDIMYSINMGESQEITGEDLAELDSICSKNPFSR